MKAILKFSIVMLFAALSFKGNAQKIGIVGGVNLSNMVETSDSLPFINGEV